jgi:hypothetical protein
MQKKLVIGTLTTSEGQCWDFAAVQHLLWR